MKIVGLNKNLKAFLKDQPLLRYTIFPFARWSYHSVKYAGEALFKARYFPISKRKFIDDIKTSIKNDTGYASGKIGYSEQHWMYYEILLEKEKNLNNIKKFEEYLNFHALKQEGIFPADPNFYIEFNNFYISHVKNIDCLGICYRPWELEIIKYYKLKNKLIHYPYQQIDQASPGLEKDCYLPHFKDKKILIVCPFAEILKERATKEIFEGVWSKTAKKKWFYPKSIDALEFPYGFSEETHKKYSTVLDLFKYITTEIEKRDFDIALIAAGGLAIPIASHIKSMGKIGIDLGGHLQLIFGVIGKRWRVESPFWATYCFNEWWTDMPAKYRPKETDVCDSGAYW